MSDWYSADPVVADAPKGLDNRARDYAIRTIYGEAANEPDMGQAAVAAVIKNRMEAGRYGGTTVPQVVLAKNQFEPWGDARARSRMMSLAENDPAYQKIGDIVDQIFTGQMPDPTGGMTHFFSPSAQAALGRQPPSWAKGENLAIGGHTFFAPEGKVAAKSADWWSGDPVDQPQPKAADIPFEGPMPPQRTLGQKLSDIWENPGGAITVRLAKDIANKMNVLGDYSQGKIPADPDSAIPGGLPKEVQDAAGGLAQIASPMAPGRLLANSVKPSLSIPLPPSRPQPVAAPTVEQLKESYRSGMASPEVRSVHGDSSLANRVASDVRAGLEAKDVDEILAPKTLATIDKWEKNKAEGESVTIRDIEALRRRLGKLAGSSDGDERAAATIARRAVDDFYTNFEKSPGSTVVFGDLEKAVPIITNSRADYRSAKLAELLDAKKYRAELRSDAANSGMNMGNTLRQRMADVLTGPEGRGLTPELRSGMEGVVHGTTGTNTARIVGNVLGGGGGIGATAVGIGGAVATGSPLVVLAPVIGNIVRRLGNHMTEKQVATLNEAARLNSPLARRLAGPSQDFEKAARAIEISVTPRNFARLTLAARNLSNNLKDAGVLIPANDIMRSIQVPQKSAADQQPVPGRPGQ